MNCRYLEGIGPVIAAGNISDVAQRFLPHKSSRRGHPAQNEIHSYSVSPWVKYGS